MMKKKRGLREEMKVGERSELGVERGKHYLGRKVDSGVFVWNLDFK